VLAFSGFLRQNIIMENMDDTPLLGWQIEDDITSVLESMQTQLDEQSAQLDKQSAQLEKQAELIEKQAALIKYYEGQLLQLRRRQFGASSEKTDADVRQINLFPEPAEVELADLETETEDITYSRKKRKGKREEDLSGLPVERIDHELQGDKRDCPNCREPLIGIGIDIRRELKLIPARVVVAEHATHAYACKNPECVEIGGGTPVIVKAESPKALIPGSLASSSLVAHIISQKYSSGMPLYRIEKGFRYDGVVISRQTMANWAIKSTQLYLILIYFALITCFKKETVGHSDGTHIQVLREPGRAPQAKSCVRVYRSSEYSERKIVLYEYTETKGSEHPKSFLEGFAGFLHTDGESGYHNLPENIIIVGCWAHLRRYWENLYKTIPKDKRKGSDAERGLAYINQLFLFEREFIGLSPQERYETRLEKSKPVSDSFFAWAEKLAPLPKSPLGAPVHYALSQRRFLENVFLDGRLELSNNRAERSIKPFVMGRKTWLFSTSPEGAEASAVLYSIIETAKENGLHPFNYVKYLLEVLPISTTDDVEGLLPWSTTLPDFCRAVLQ
jgi:transposase